MAKLTLIAAMDLNHGIGIENRLPWHIPDDLKRFKAITSGHPVIMGRKTFESIGKPLPGRRNIVLTRDPAWAYEGVEVVNCIDDAIAIVKEEREAFVIGGADIFERMLFKADRLLITLIYDEFNCDAFFPYFVRKGWSISAFEPHIASTDGLPYVYITYENTRKPGQPVLTTRERIRYFLNGFREGLSFTPLWTLWRKYARKGE